MGKLLFYYFVAFFFVSGLVGIVTCQNCPVPACRGKTCGAGGAICGDSSCQCTLNPGSGGVGTCTSCAGELCKCSTASGPSRQLCCKGFSCVQPNKMPAVGDGTCRNLAKGI